MPTTRRPDPAKQRAALEARRLQAAELFAQGRTQARGRPRARRLSPERAHLAHPLPARRGGRLAQSGSHRPGLSRLGRSLLTPMLFHKGASS